jgi:hypothetical protein
MTSEIVKGWVSLEPLIYYGEAGKTAAGEVAGIE